MLMAAAGVIAAYGVIYANGILIVGAMAVSPDSAARSRRSASAWSPAAGGSILRALVDARRRARRGVPGGGRPARRCSISLDLLPSNFHVGEDALHGLTTVNSSTFGVALVAGIAGMLALETRASAAVGVAISVTTIPASAYLGVAAGVGEVGQGVGRAGRARASTWRCCWSAAR